MLEEVILRKFRKELNSGAASLVVLALMRASHKPLYGYQIAKLLEQKAEDQLPMKPGALYPVLRSMETQGLLQSQVEPSTSAPPRRYYTVTLDGQRILDSWIEIWQSTSDFVESVLAGVTEGGDHPEEKKDA